MFVGYGKHPFLIALRLQSIAFSIARASVWGGGTPSENGDLYVQKNTLLQQS